MRYQVHEANQRVLDAICRSDFPSFARLCFNILYPTTPFEMNWHIRAIAHALEQARRGDNRRLIVNQPPSTLKSFMGSIAWPAYILGLEPSTRIVVINYGSDLAVDLGNAFRQIITSTTYQRIFPGMRISNMKNTELNVVTTQNGFRLGTTIEGALTGLHADVIIIDDPIKPIDALSDAKRDRVNTWFSQTLLSRLNDPRTGVIVVVMQRLHEDDLSGMLLRTSPQWTPLILPAIAEHEERIPISNYQHHLRRVDDVLQPKRETIEALLDLCDQIGPDTFDAQYQQSPVPATGAMVKRDYVRYYTALPQGASASSVFQAWDVASKDGELNDYSVCTTWRRHNQIYYLIDLLRDRMDFPTLRERAISHARAQRAGLILIEDAGLGTALIAEMNKVGLATKGVKPQQSKQMRLQVQLSKFRDHQVRFPDGAHFLRELEAELLAFPRGRFDDQVDSISLGLSHEPPHYDWDKVNAGYEKFARTLWWQQQFQARMFR